MQLKTPASLVCALTRTILASTRSPANPAHAAPLAAAAWQSVSKTVKRLPLGCSWAATYNSGTSNFNHFHTSSLSSKVPGDALPDPTAAASDSAPASGPSDADMVMDMCTAHWKQQALRAAVKLGVFDAFPDPNRPQGLVPLATATGVSDRSYLYRLLQYLSQFNLFLQLDNETFVLTPMGQYLRLDHPSGLRYAAISFGEPAHYVPWMHLHEAVKNGTGAFQYYRPDLPGGVFQYMTLPENKEEEELFNNMMTTFTKTMDSAVPLHDFSGCSVVADIGGGYGELLMDIMTRYPGVKKGIVFEMPTVVDLLPALPPNFQGAISWVKGDFFQAIPVTADCYVMKSILHDWPDERCLAILSNLKAAMPAGSVLVNFDRLMPDFDATAPPFHPAKAMDMNMMTMINGKERTKQQWQDLMGQAGFTIKSITEGASMAAIVAVPA